MSRGQGERVQEANDTRKVRPIQITTKTMAITTTAQTAYKHPRFE